MPKICVIGLGYIGLPTAALFANAGNEVVGVDINPKIVDTINKGKIHIEENGLEELVKKVIENGNLRASLKPEEADVFIIAVPTPIHKDFSANIDYVIQAANGIKGVIKKGDIVIIESTIPPRTTDDVVAPILQEAGFNVHEDIYLAHCPERVLPGRILEELVYNTRIVGGINPLAAKKAADVYRLVVKGEIIETSAVTAEMTKLMENTYRDVNIALANELVKICSRLNINAHEVIKLANKHPRVNIHLPGPGVGGHCLAVDPYFIVEKAPEEALLIKTARDINKSMPDFVVKHTRYLVSEIKNPVVSIFGLSYKGNIDDIRESPAIDIYEKLRADGHINLKVFDPHVQQDQTEIPLLTFEEAVAESNLILILTDHNEFKSLDFNKIKSLMRTPVIFDTRNCVNNVDEEGITVYKIGNLGQLKTIHAN
jgi:UDP-N-acetyl-D-mannosaminuronic acid dehydrogenase